MLRSPLTPSAARRLDLPYDQAQHYINHGRRFGLTLIEVQEFEVGDAGVQRLQVGIVPLSGPVFDGLPGMNFLQQFASSIDQRRRAAFG